jgi:hypothetical protein
MRKAFFLIFILINLDAHSSVYYVASNGNDNNPGTFIKPWLTWQKGFDVAIAGDTVFIRGGIYYTSGTIHGGQCIGVFLTGKNGKADSRITIQTYPGETPVLDGSTMAANSGRCGIYLSNCSYLTLKGLTVRNVKEYGQFKGCPLAESILLAKCTNIKFEKCVVNGCGDGFGTSGFCDYIDFLNCDAFGNIDFCDEGGYSNGWTLTMYLNPGVYASGTHVSLTGCRSWGNSDDGFDMYGANGYFTYIDCWAFDNGRYNGNGDGFKSHPKGSIESGVQRKFIRCISFDNKGSGFTSTTYVIENMYNCISYNNGKNGIGYNIGNNLACVFKNNISFKNALSQYSGMSNFINLKNTWNQVKVSKSDFMSLDTAGVSGARLPDGNLPDLSFLKLVSASALIDAGSDIGLPFNGIAPDIGAYEMSKDVSDSSRKSKISWLKLIFLLFCP